MRTEWRPLHLAFYLGLATLIASTVGAGWVLSRYPGRAFPHGSVGSCGTSPCLFRLR